MHVSISDFVTEEVLLGGTVLEDDRLISSDDFSSSIFQSSMDGVNFPNSRVNLLVDNTDFLVSRESGKGLRGNGGRAQV